MNFRSPFHFLKRLLGKPKQHAPSSIPPDIASDSTFMELFKRTAPFTMTSPERMYALYRAIRHIQSNNVPGDIVECGVWRGGSSMLAAATLLESGDTGRTLYLYDTFEGMPPPDKQDGARALSKWESKVARGEANTWCFASLEDVTTNMYSTGYPKDHIVFTRGKVEETIPHVIPEHIALLRLDTDWYASTKHELEHLFPRLSSGGIIIIDDYGTWEGARKAVDEYLALHGIGAFLHRIDGTGALAIKN